MKYPERILRLLARTDRTPGGCWEVRTVDPTSGYGRFTINGKVGYAHRYAYESMVEPIPAGLQIDHLCRNRACCNPAHLEPVTQRENLMRGNTIVRAHHEGRFCGADSCPSCKRFRQAVSA